MLGPVVGRAAGPNNHIMRKWIITLGVAALTTIAHAQTKGFISGQASISSTGSLDDRAKNFTGVFGPSVGFNLSDRIAVGLGLDIIGSAYTNVTESVGSITDTDRKTHSVNIAPFVRYMKKVDENFSFFGQLSVGVGFGKSTEEYVTSGNGTSSTTKLGSDQNSFRTAIGPGVQYTFAPHWAITANWGALEYESRTSAPDAEDAEDHTQNSFGLALNADALTFGLNWFY